LDLFIFPPGLAQVLVALKAGQGGTPLDVDLGCLANTWRIVEVAHAAGLVCAAVGRAKLGEGGGGGEGSCGSVGAAGARRKLDWAAPRCGPTPGCPPPPPIPHSPFPIPHPPRCSRLRRRRATRAAAAAPKLTAFSPAARSSTCSSTAGGSTCTFLVQTHVSPYPCVVPPCAWSRRAFLTCPPPPPAGSVTALKPVDLWIFFCELVLLFLFFFWGGGVVSGTGRRRCLRPSTNSTLAFGSSTVQTPRALLAPPWRRAAILIRWVRWRVRRGTRRAGRRFAPRWSRRSCR
jgi:hypothetical protein